MLGTPRYSVGIGSFLSWVFGSISLLGVGGRFSETRTSRSNSSSAEPKDEPRRTQREAELLAKCYRNALNAADNLGLTSIAFCTFSTGSFGFALGLTAPIELATIKEGLLCAKSIKELRSAKFGAEECATFDQICCGSESVHSRCAKSAPVKGPTFSVHRTRLRVTKPTPISKTSSDTGSGTTL